MLQQSFRTELVEWLKEIVPFNQIDKYTLKTREGYQAETASASPDDVRHNNYVNYIICTEEHSYSISAHPSYLGCIASTRKCRAGENWTRGNDLPDGPSCYDTWQKIKDAILRYELVKIEAGSRIGLPDGASLPPNVTPFSPEEEAYTRAHCELMQAQLKFDAAERAWRGLNKREEAMPATRLSAEEVK